MFNGVDVWVRATSLESMCRFHLHSRTPPRPAVYRRCSPAAATCSVAQMKSSVHAARIVRLSQRTHKITGIYHQRARAHIYIPYHCSSHRRRGVGEVLQCLQFLIVHIRSFTCAPSHVGQWPARSCVWLSSTGHEAWISSVQTFVMQLACRRNFGAIITMHMMRSTHRRRCVLY
jgi:hypothetical protein